MCHFHCSSQVKSHFSSLLSAGRFLRGLLSNQCSGGRYFRNLVMLPSLTVTISKLAELTYYSRPQTALGRQSKGTFFFVQAFLIYTPLWPYRQISDEVTPHSR